MKMRNILLIVLGCFIALPEPLFSQGPAESALFTIEQTKPVSSGLFDSDDLLEISLRFDITYFKRKKSQDEYLDAVMTFHYNDVDSLSRNIRIQSRGERRYELCSFPPIRLNIEDSEMAQNDLEKVKNIKLVTHCNPQSAYQEYVFMEYLVYKLFNIVTDTSFQVRLLKINYFDTGRRKNHETKYGFMIEPVKMIEQRLNAEEVEDVIVRDYHLEQYSLDVVSLFQYMIGNEDWQVATLHNLKVFRVNNNTTVNVIVIPYDFDYSGIMDTPYAYPHESRPIETVKERLYLGPLRTDEQFLARIEMFRGYKDQIINTIEEFELLGDRQKRNMLSYIESFYSDLENDRLLRQIKFDIANR